MDSRLSPLMQLSSVQRDAHRQIGFGCSGQQTPAQRQNSEQQDAQRQYPGLKADSNIGPRYEAEDKETVHIGAP